MKKITFIVGIFFYINCYSQVGIGTVNPNGALEVSSNLPSPSTQKAGFVPPKVALTATNSTLTNIAGVSVVNPENNLAPVAGTIVYNTNNSAAGPNQVTVGYYFYNGTIWEKISTSANKSWELTGNSGTNSSSNYIGTSDVNDLVLKTNNTERLRINNAAGVTTGTTGDISIGDANTGTIKSNRELVLRQDGDQFGSSALRLRNRNGENGAIFENLNPLSNANLVDFIFKTGTNALPIQSNIRFETRNGNIKATGNSTEWQFGQPDNVNGGPTFVVGANGTGSISSFLQGRVGIGIPAARAALEINSATNGILIPRVSLTSTSVATPVVNPSGGAILESTLVYNTQTAADVTPGYYFWTGIKWSRFVTNATAGTILKTAMINITGSDVIVNSNSFTSISSQAYFPVSANSTIIVEFNTKYDIGGWGDDSFTSQILIEGSQIVYNSQKFTAGSSGGGGTRSGNLMPLMGAYTNSSLTSKTINIEVKRDVADDNAIFKRDASTWLKITEIAR